MEVSPNMVQAVEFQTRGQRTNPLWLSARAGSVTASNFGAVLCAIQCQSFPDSLFTVELYRVNTI